VAEQTREELAARIRRERLAKEELQRRLNAAMWLITSFTCPADPGLTAVLLMDLRTVLTSSQDEIDAAKRAQEQPARSAAARAMVGAGA
jgi:hypothetical protein